MRNTLNFKPLSAKQSAGKPGLNAAVGRVLIRAAGEANFRRAMLEDMGSALAAEGFLLTDDEMRLLREQWDGLRGLSERMAAERIRAMAWAYREE